MDVGNENDAQDLYGFGIRLGIYLHYLQAVSMCFSLFRLKAHNMKITVAGLMLALLACWSRLVAQRAISPSEVLVMLSCACYI
jgi:hypothetical protein